MVTAAVLTVTSGREELARCIDSVRGQTFPCRHYLFCDRAMTFQDYVRWRCDYRDCRWSYWDAKAGGVGLEGRRLYAAASGLMDEDVILMLNDDDWFEPGHVESLVALIEEGADWAFSLRRIYDRDGKYLFNDDCEALGEHPVWNSDPSQPHFLVEHSAFALKREIFNQYGALFNYRGYGVDRVFTAVLKEKYTRYAGSGKYTLCYSLGGNPMSVKAEFFEKGNAFMKDKYPDGFPWAKA